MFKWLMAKKWRVGNVVIYLWPFVSMAIFLAGIVFYDLNYA